jgi:hypothetical protein
VYSNSFAVAIIAVRQQSLNRQDSINSRRLEIQVCTKTTPYGVVRIRHFQTIVVIVYVATYITTAFRKTRVLERDRPALMTTGHRLCHLKCAGTRHQIRLRLAPDSNSPPVHQRHECHYSSGAAKLCSTPTDHIVTAKTTTIQYHTPVGIIDDNALPISMPSIPNSTQTSKPNFARYCC